MDLTYLVFIAYRFRDESSHQVLDSVYKEKIAALAHREMLEEAFMPHWDVPLHDGSGLVVRDLFSSLTIIGVEFVVVEMPVTGVIEA